MFEKINNKMNPATVGGSTSGSVRIPSMTAFFPGGAMITLLAAKIPRKKEIQVATAPVFSEMIKGL